MIRDAAASDINDIYVFCIKALKQAVYGGVPYDERKIRKLICRYVSSKQMFCKLSVIDGEICGILSASAQEIFFSRKKEASDLIFYAEKGGEGAKLLLEFKKWADKKDVALSGISVMFGGESIDRTGKLIESCGFERVGGVYMRVHQNE